jgi:hypothetical protein
MWSFFGKALLMGLQELFRLEISVCTISRVDGNITEALGRPRQT